MLISCLMPTADRRPFVPMAITCFLNQTHPDRELIVLDDGSQDISDLIPTSPNIFLFTRPNQNRTLGEKLNTCAQLAKGVTCCNWDDDDWSSPDRLAHQLEFMLKSKTQAVGFSSLYYWDTTTNQARHWQWNRREPYACGSSQMYTRAWLIAHPLPNQTLNVDYNFTDTAYRHRQLATESGDPYLVARYHHHSRWRSPLAKCGFPIVPTSALPPGFIQAQGIALLTNQQPLG